VRSTGSARDHDISANIICPFGREQLSRVGIFVALVQARPAQHPH
jgi:hypothetical protein